MMKENNINKVYYSNNDGGISCFKVNDLIPDHISYGTIESMKQMTKINQFMIFGFTIDREMIDVKHKKIIIGCG